MSLKRISKPDHTVGSHAGESPVVESTASAQASPRLVPGDERNEGDGGNPVCPKRRRIRRRFGNSEAPDPEPIGAPVQRKFQPATDEAGQINLLAVPPSLRDQVVGWEFILCGNVRENRRRIPVGTQLR